jgi:SAM-dependent methyltransferase
VLWAAEEEALVALGAPREGRGLDLGCGPGYVATRLRRTRPGLRLVGADRDREVLCGVGLPAVRADGRSLPFGDGLFDFALARLVLRHVPEPGAVLAEARRILAPSGVLVALDSDDGTLVLDPLPAGFAAVLAARHRTFARRRADPHLGRRLPGLMAAAGFREVGVVPLDVLSTAIGARAFAAIVLAPIADAIDGDLMPAGEVSAAAEAIRTWGESPGAFGMTTALVVSGRR